MIFSAPTYGIPVYILQISFDAGVFNEYEKENLKLAVEMEQ